jgi:hypothetical protein
LQSTVPSAAPSGIPPKHDENDGGNPFKQLETVPDTATVLNSCECPVFLWSVGHNCDGPEAVAKLIEAGGTYSEPIRKCESGGVALKISKTTDASKPMQFEYAVWATDPSMVSYDISYLDCLKNGSGEKDLSGCAGHEGGTQAVGGGDGKNFRCGAGEWCDVQAYVVAEFANLPGAPVGGCKVHHGVAFELCAGNR